MKDIICISMTTWEGDYMKTIVHMMGNLAKNHRVLFVDYPFTLKDLAFTLAGKSKAPVKRMLGIEPRLRTVHYQGVEVHHLTLPPTVPSNWIKSKKLFRSIVSLQSHLVATSIRKASKKLGFLNPLVINAFNPLIGLDLIGKLRESATLYYCYDEIAAAPWCGKHGAVMEALFIEKADQVVVSSTGLFESKSLKNPKTTLIKNAVDFKLFHQAYRSEPASKDRKTVGYIGSVDFRLDYSLLSEVISGNPEVDFHFVGRITDLDGAAHLSSFSNVRLTGSVQPNLLPDYLRSFDAGLIPFLKNEFTRNIYPLKINEYLAAGIPVITTDFADLSDFKGVVSIASTTTQFDEQLKLALRQSSPEEINLRIATARENDWSARALEMEKLIETVK